MPDLLIISGVNGAGKSTIFPALQRTEKVAGSFQPEYINTEDFINPDNIQKENNISNLEASKISIKTAYLKLKENKSIAIETTLSGKSQILNLIKEAKSLKYRVYIVYLLLYSAELSMARVVQRALQGKHYIPMKNILERYSKSINNFLNLYKKEADFWVVADNSKLVPEILCWGGNIYQSEILLSQSKNQIDRYQQILEKNIISFNLFKWEKEEFSLKVFEKIKFEVENELSKRPKGTTLVHEENGILKFTDI
jgi:predicted ABC-type ATPase